VHVIRRGAEAEIRKGVWMGRDVIFKSRVPKGYRHPDLDSSLRISRTRNEARLIQEARRLGVPTPVIYDIDTVDATLVMQEIKGPRVKDLLDSSGPQERGVICMEVGRSIGLLHKGGIAHGDLTTSNMIWSEDRVWFIDFSLGSKNAEMEELGVDLHLLNEAFQSAHSHILDCYDIIVNAYRSTFPKADIVLKKVKEIEERGRYT
jgi:TP53 regulating kinase-like protein